MVVTDNQVNNSLFKLSNYTVRGVTIYVKFSYTFLTNCSQLPSPGPFPLPLFLAAPLLTLWPLSSLSQEKEQNWVIQSKCAFLGLLFHPLPQGLQKLDLGSLLKFCHPRVRKTMTTWHRAAFEHRKARWAHPACSAADVGQAIGRNPHLITRVSPVPGK